MRSLKTKYNYHLKSAKQRGIETYLTYRDFVKLKLSSCHYCGVDSLFLSYYCKYMQIATPYMTLDRKENNLPYSIENTVPACFLCNRTKSNIFSEEEFLEIGSKYIRPKWEKWHSEVYEDYDLWCQLNISSPDEEE